MKRELRNKLFHPFSDYDPDSWDTITRNFWSGVSQQFHVTYHNADWVEDG